jgi:hypothetical protein
MTVRVVVEVSPFWSVATQSMASVATVLVSIWMGFIGAPLT